jgi:hypothetical protein
MNRTPLWFHGGESKVSLEWTGTLGHGDGWGGKNRVRMTAGQAALAILVWIALAVLAALAAFYLLAAVLSLASWMIESPTWRPYGWFQGTLAAVSRFSTLVLGAVWLFLVMFMEHDLRTASREKRFWRRTGWYVLWLCVTLLGSLAVTYILA